MSRDDRFLAPDDLAARYGDVLRRSATSDLPADEWEDARSRAAECAWGVGGFVTQGGRVLLIRQGRRWSGSKPWIAPGGMLEVGETHAEGAAREVREETGLGVEIDGLAAIQERTFVHEGESREFEFRFAMFDATPTTAELATDPGLNDEDILAVEWFEALPEKTYERDLLTALKKR